MITQSLYFIYFWGEYMTTLREHHHGNNVVLLTRCCQTYTVILSYMDPTTGKYDKNILYRGSNQREANERYIYGCHLI